MGTQILAARLALVAKATLEQVQLLRPRKKQSLLQLKRKHQRPPRRKHQSQQKRQQLPPLQQKERPLTSRPQVQLRRIRKRRRLQQREESETIRVAIICFVGRVR